MCSVGNGPEFFGGYPPTEKSCFRSADGATPEKAVQVGMSGEFDHVLKLKEIKSNAGSKHTWGSTSDLLGKVGLNLASGLVTSCYGQ